ncbi:cell envelope integrity protein TolA [Undibacterium pigrum]|uniref:Cell division and transport-associated protein TolA n=1 Tax=Undibacterium pigrum TaxID=401470 RepID=A0A318JJP2_9BURK|nr:TonB C-terminal domain-containing protein [Undibacterium pigrum]PXX47649.1 cell division and transport-associated protein TolA [Undibacterium pigrum]
MNQVSQQAHPDFHQHQTGQLRSIALAALVHVILLSFLWVGVRWQNKPAEAQDVEVWDLTYREAAPKPVPVPEPVIEKIKEPEPVKAEVRQEDPEIVLAQEKKRKLLEKKKEEEHQRELAEKKRKEEQQDKLAEQKRKEEKLAQEAADKKKLLAKEKEKSTKEKSKVYDEEMARVTKQAVGTGSTGTSEKSTGNNRGDPSYIAKIAAKVRSNTNFSGIDSTAGNPTVEYLINLLPDGSLRGAIRKVKSSGNIAFDDAVAAAIEKSAPFPRDKTGQVPASLTLAHRMKEE